MNKSTILTAASPTQIFMKYLNLDDWPRGNISSPFSEDKKASFKIYKNGTFKCHSTGRQGDAFQFVADLYELDCKSQFDSVLEIIAKDFNIDDPQKHFDYTCKELSTAHLDYWKQGNWNVTKEILDRYYVRALDKFEYYSAKKDEISKHKIFKGIAAFAYELNSRVELYIPKQAKANKFILNKTKSEDIFGLKQLPSHSATIIISAGKKDALILNANGFPSISFRSENHHPTTDQIQQLSNRCDRLCICYDNDEQGQQSMNKITSAHNITPIKIQAQYNDIADYFQSHTATDFQIFVKESLEAHQVNTKEESTNTIFHVTEKYLSRRYLFRFNTIALDIEFRRKGNPNWEVLNENTLFVELQKKGIKCSMNNLLAILKSDFVTHFNPLISYYESLPKWNGYTDHIQHLLSFINPLDRDQFDYHFKKWIVRAVKCAIEPEYFNKQAFIFVQRGQNTGKSTFCRFLCPPSLSNYIAEDISQDKDARIMLCKNLLINLDELAGLNKKELEGLKSIFSKTRIKERLPYDKKASTLNRTCSFIGSTNEDAFLNDTTGSVRWLCFRIKSIDWNYKKEVDIDQVWGQAYHLATNNFDCELSYSDIQANEKRNKLFQILSTEQELISKYIEQSNKEVGEFATATDIIVHLTPLKIRLSKVQVGKALTALGFKKVKHSKRQVYGYWVNKLPLFSDFKTEWKHPNSNQN